MPVPAVDMQEFEAAAKTILHKVLEGEHLSPFDKGRFEIQADKMPDRDFALQLRGLVCLGVGDETGFYDNFQKALLITQRPTDVRTNYAIALTYLGDYEEASAQIAEIMKDPVTMIRTGSYVKCLAISRLIMDDELQECLVAFAERYGIKNSAVGGEILTHLMGKLEDDDPLLLSYLDTSDYGQVPLEDSLPRIQHLVEEIEADNA